MNNRTILLITAIVVFMTLPNVVTMIKEDAFSWSYFIIPVFAWVATISVLYIAEKYASKSEP